MSKTDYDLAGRTIRTIENFFNFVPSPADDKTTEFAYNGSNQLTVLTAVIPEVVPGTPNYQKTEYVYGVTTSGSDLNSNELLATIKYPDKTNGNPSGSSNDWETFKYNRQSEVKEMKQRRDTVHVYEFDVVGRPTEDKVTTLSGADGTVRRLQTQYDTAGRPFRFTSHTDVIDGTIRNQVERQFNGLGQLTFEYQAHGGAVDSNTPRVSYIYSEMAGGVNHSRLTKLTYPDGRFVNYHYLVGLNNDISRLTSITNGGSIYEQYGYLGLDTVIKRAHQEPVKSGCSTSSKASNQTAKPAIRTPAWTVSAGSVDQRWLKTTREPARPLAIRLRPRQQSEVPRQHGQRR